MTRDELKDLACLGFTSDLVLQSFCHTAAYPKPIDIVTHNTLLEFINNRGGISLKPGDGIIHSWLNRMLLPDTVGTGWRLTYSFSDWNFISSRFRTCSFCSCNRSNAFINA